VSPDELRPRRVRPRSRRAPEQRYERAALHSITSSARASNVGSTWRYHRSSWSAPRLWGLYWGKAI